MEEDLRCRLSLLGGSTGESQSLMVPPCPSIIDLPSRHHLFSSVLLPPFHLMPVCFSSSRGPGFFHYHVPLAPTPIAGGGGDGSHHMCSLSDVPFFSVESISLPAYSHLGGSTAIPFAPSLVGFNQGLPGQPPLWEGHRRSQSDIDVGFSQQNLQMPPLPPVKLEITMTEEQQSRGTMVTTLHNLVGSNMGLKMHGSSSNATREQIEREHMPIESTENKANSRGGGNMPRHCRSLSVDNSFMTRNLDLRAVGQEMINSPPPSTWAGVGGSLLQVGNGSIGYHTALITAKLANGGFSDAEKKTIMESEHLSELMLTNPKKVKRILNNRKSSARSKERKLKYKIELERKVQLLQMESTKLSEQLAMVQREFGVLLAENNELKISVQEMNQQAHMSDALFDAMAAKALQFVALCGFDVPQELNEWFTPTNEQPDDPTAAAANTGATITNPAKSAKIKSEPLG